MHIQIFLHHYILKLPTYLVFPQYYSDNKICKLCEPLCKTSGENCNKCESCFDGYYLKDSKCNKCNAHCKTCKNEDDENNENCETCDINSDFKYLINATGYGNNCVNKCPSGTELNNNTCILFNPKKEEESNILVIVLPIVCVILVIVVAGIIFLNLRKRKWKPNISMDKTDDKLINEINNELNLYKSFDNSKIN